VLGPPYRPLLTVDLSELCIARKTETTDLRWYLDVTTSEVLLVSHEYAPEEHDGLTAGEIEAARDRFFPVPKDTLADSLDDMRAFAAQVTDPRLKESLDLALSGWGPERRFKALLSWLPELLDAWYAFRDLRVEARVLSWLHSLGYAPKR
jgi:hypothetical protein